jgi:hypothetical protein
MLHNMLEACRSNFGEAPRQFSLWDRLTYLRVPKPLWLQQNRKDKMMIHFKHLKTTLAEGTVVWGHVIQANALMFEPGTANCPGEIVYSIHDSSRAKPHDLQEIAQALYRLKGTKPADPELAPIANYLADEYIRVFGLPVPRTISQSLRCMISSTFFVRKHLPKRRLWTPLLPVIVNRTQPHVAVPLPERYWPSDLVAWWTGTRRGTGN